MSRMENDLAPAQKPDRPLRTYVVFESNPVIAADLCGTIESFSACRMIHVTSIEALEAALRDVPDVWAAFVDLSLRTLEQTGAGAWLRERGAHIVITSGESDMDAASDSDITMLIRPFTEQMILQSLADAATRRAR